MRNQFVFALSILTLCLCQPVLAQTAQEENKVVSKVPLRNFEGAWSEAQMREWVNGPVKEWLDKTALFYSMLTPENWDDSSEEFLKSLRQNFEAGKLHVSIGQANRTLLLSQPYSLSANLGIMKNFDSILTTLGNVTNTDLTFGPSQELVIELINHLTVGIYLSAEVADHVDALIRWYEAAVTSPQW